MKCEICGKESEREIQRGTTLFDGKRFDTENGAFIVSIEKGLLCKECYDKVKGE